MLRTFVGVEWVTIRMTFNDSYGVRFDASGNKSLWFEFILEGVSQGCTRSYKSRRNGEIGFTQFNLNYTKAKPPCDRKPWSYKEAGKLILRPVDVAWV